MVDIVKFLGAPLTLRTNENPQSAEQQLREEINKSGLHAPKQIIFDGKIHRFSGDAKHRDDSAWYVAFDGEIPAAAFGCWRSDMSATWRADIGRELTTLEIMHHNERMDAIKKLREEELAQRRAESASKANNIWNLASEAMDDHPYLIKKQINANGMKLTPDNHLITPVYINNAISSVQYISEEGEKKFLPGGAISGGYWIIGKPTERNRVFLCEGVATGCSIHEATGEMVVIAYSAGNLINVARTLRDTINPLVRIVVVGDNDESGVGQSKATEAARAINAELVISPVGDANDFATQGGDLKALLIPEQPKLTMAYDWFDDLINNPIPIRWLIKGVVPRQSLGMIHGPSGGGKSFIALDMTLRIATDGGEWCGHKVKPGLVFYAAGEGHAGMRQRMRAWNMTYGGDGAQFVLSRTGVNLNTSEGLRNMCEALDSLPTSPSCITIDTLHRFLLGDENSAQDAKTMIDACVYLMERYNCTVILVHHTGNSEEAQHRARGSSAWRGALDFEMSVKPGKDGVIQVIQRKQKDAELSKDLSFKLESFEIGWHDEDGEPVRSGVVRQVELSDAEIAELNEPKSLRTAKEDFNRMMTTYGRLERGEPYVSNIDWSNHAKDNYGSTPGAQRTKASTNKKMLREAGYIREQSEGWIVIDQMAASVLRLSMGSAPK